MDVWKKSIKLVKHIYKITSSFPREEMYSLTSQLRRSSVSIPSNIAEGRARESTKEYLRFVEIAYSSLAEVETQLIISSELNFLGNESVDKLLLETAEIGRMLNGLSKSLKARLFPDLRPLTSDLLENVE